MPAVASPDIPAAVAVNLVPPHPAVKLRLASVPSPKEGNPRRKRSPTSTLIRLLNVKTRGLAVPGYLLLEKEISLAARRPRLTGVKLSTGFW